MNLDMFKHCLYAFQYINCNVSRQMAPPQCTIFIYNWSNIYLLLGKVTFFPVLWGKQKASSVNILGHAGYHIQQKPFIFLSV